MIIADLEERRNYKQYLLKRPSALFWLPAKIIAFLTGFLCRRIFSIAEAFIKVTRKVIFAGRVFPIRRELLSSNKKLDLTLFPGVKLFSFIDKEFTEICLATTTIPAVVKIDWNASFPDREDIYALHRFGWLLSALIRCPSKELAEKALAWLSDWIEKMGRPGDSPAWESYSVAERLSNWPFILALLEQFIPIHSRLRTAMEDALISQMDYLNDNLEFRGNLTNNHLLNDARGLYVSGVLLDSNLARKRAEEIIREWTPRLFYDDGMLKENSSHYQYLLCQRYEQLYFLSSHVGDRQFQDFLRHWLGLLRQSAKFFSVYGSERDWDLPLIGDLSPDFNPRWLAPIAGSEWTELKRCLGWLDISETCPGKPKGLEIKKGGFIRYNQGEVALFWHLNDDGSTFISHGHYDWGSFVLFYRGKSVVVDPGRYSYMRAGSYGVRARAHSSLLIDGLGAQCEDQRLNSFKAYGLPKMAYRLKESAQELVLEMETDGFRRLQTPVAWQRKFIVRPNVMIITDTLESCGINRVETRFQVDSWFQVQAKKDGFAITSDGIPPLELRINGAATCHRVLLNAEIEDGWVSKEYGQRSSGTTILLERELQHRQVHRYEIIWQ